jgi:DNA-binding MarR family transcriptional regulator
MLLQNQANGDRRAKAYDQRTLAAASLNETLSVMLLLWLTKQPRSLIDIEAAFGLDPCNVVGTMARLIRADLLGITRDPDAQCRAERRFYTKTQAFKRAIAEQGRELAGAGDTRVWRTDFPSGHSVAAHVALAAAEGAISADDC